MHIAVSAKDTVIVSMLEAIRSIFVKKKFIKITTASAMFGAGLDVFEKVTKKEKPELGSAIKRGLDTGVKGALACGAKKVIPKKLSFSSYANIAMVTADNMKTASKIVTKELSFQDGMDKISEDTITTIVSSVISGTAGTVFGPAGTIAGELVGIQFSNDISKKIYKNFKGRKYVD